MFFSGGFQLRLFLVPVGVEGLFNFSILISSETAQKSSGNVPRQQVNTVPSAFPERSKQ